MTKYGVSLLSGGLDSTTVTTQAINEVDDITALTFHYNQLGYKEIACSKLVTNSLGIEHIIIDISSVKDLVNHSSLINPSLVNGSNFEQQNNKPNIPMTYVPMRNTIFISLAAAFLENRILQSIEKHRNPPEDTVAKIFLGANVVDFSGYPDCRPDFFSRMEHAICYGSKLYIEYGIKIEIINPILNLSKAQIIKLGKELDAPIHLTWSCYQEGDEPCGACESCQIRSSGFEQAGFQDLTQP